MSFLMRNKTNKGQTLPLMMITLAVTLALIYANIDRIHWMTQKIRAQKEADAIAMVVGTEIARSYNAMAGLNQGIESMASQMVMFTAGLVAASIGAVFTLNPVLAKIAAAGLQGFLRMSKNFTKIGKEIEIDMNKLTSRVYTNVCHEMDRYKLWVLVEWIRQNHSDMRDLSLDDLSPREASRWIREINGLRKPLARIYPDICDAEQPVRPPLERIPAKEKNVVHCETHTLTSKSDWMLLQQTKLYRKSLSKGQGRFVFSPEDATDPKPLVFETYRSFDQNIPGQTEPFDTVLMLDAQAQAPEAGGPTYRFVFDSGEVETCFNAHDMLNEYKHRFNVADLPDLIQGTNDFKEKSTFLIKLSLPVRSKKPFVKSSDLLQTPDTRLIHQVGLDEVLGHIETILDTLEDGPDRIEVFSQVTVDGKRDFSQMEFVPKLMEASLQ